MPTDDVRRLLEELHPASFGWAVSCASGDRGEAEVILQTASLLVLDGTARWSGRSSFRTWFFGVVRNVAASRRRRRRLENALFPAASEEILESGDGPATAGDAASGTDVRRALGALPARQRDVLRLVFYEGMTVEESARALGVPLGTARTHYQRGKARMRRALAVGAALVGVVGAALVLTRARAPRPSPVEMTAWTSPTRSLLPPAGPAGAVPRIGETWGAPLSKNPKEMK